MPFNTQPPYSLIRVIDQTMARDFDVTYVNTTGRTMFVNISFRSEVSALNDQGRVYIIINGSVLSDVGHDAAIAFTARSRFNLNFQVMPGSSYLVSKLTSGSGIVDLGAWIESH